jgi:AraC family ethanolamine operon transcriptional activator
MPVRELKASPVLAYERFSSFEEFRPNDVIGGGTSIPLAPRDFSASRAAVALPASRLVIQRSFARRLEADMGAPGAALVIPLSGDACAEINGQAITSSHVALFRGVVPTRSLEPQANTFVMLRFHSEIQNRGWLDVHDGFEILPTAPDRMHRLQSVLLNIARHAAECTDVREFAQPAYAMQESLLGALDDVLVSEHAVRPRPMSLARHRRVVAGLDELIHHTPAVPFYSGDLARNLGVSVRTLQTAVNVVHGTSLHFYLRLKRLWSARCSLALGLPGLSIKRAAVANGFWHMGEFSRLYKAVFGDLPSQTLMRSRRL